MTSTVPSIWYKTQRVLRTFVQVGIPAFLTFALVLPQIIEALGLPVDSGLRLWLVAVAAGVTAVAGAIARVMAIPAVNAWLTKIGLGSVPKSAVRTGQAGAYVARDPKVTAHDRFSGLVTTGTFHLAGTGTLTSGDDVAPDPKAVAVDDVIDASTQQRYPLHRD